MGRTSIQMAAYKHWSLGGSAPTPQTVEHHSAEHPQPKPLNLNVFKGQKHCLTTFRPLE